MEKYDKITAKFNPPVTADMAEVSKKWIGRTMEWQAAWIIEEGDYEGQWAMTPSGPERHEAPFLWAPYSDLEVGRMNILELDEDMAKWAPNDLQAVMDCKLELEAILTKYGIIYSTKALCQVLHIPEVKL